jgi:hypothetical protein
MGHLPMLPMAKANGGLKGGFQGPEQKTTGGASRCDPPVSAAGISSCSTENHRTMRAVGSGDVRFHLQAARAMRGLGGGGSGPTSNITQENESGREANATRGAPHGTLTASAQVGRVSQGRRCRPLTVRGTQCTVLSQKGGTSNSPIHRDRHSWPRTCTSGCWCSARQNTARLLRFESRYHWRQRRAAAPG